MKYKTVSEKAYITIDGITEELSPDIADMIYRDVWCKHVEEDLKELAKNEDYTLTEDEVEYLAYKYVYEGKYDCNQSYWDNLRALIENWRRNS